MINGSYNPSWIEQRECSNKCTEKFKSLKIKNHRHSHEINKIEHGNEIPKWKMGIKYGNEWRN